VVSVEDASESPQWSEIETASGRPLIASTYVTHSDPGDGAWMVSIDAISLGGVVTIEVDPARQRPEGSCLDESSELYGESGLLVLAAGVEPEASLNFEEVGYCPGHEYEGRGGFNADGFLYTLEDNVSRCPLARPLPLSARATRGPC